MAVALSAKGQVTIPREIRKILKINSGDRVDFVVDKESVKLKAVKKEQAKTLAGSLNKYAKGSYTNKETREATKRKVAFDTAKEG